MKATSTRGLMPEVPEASVTGVAAGEALEGVGALPAQGPRNRPAPGSTDDRAPAALTDEAAGESGRRPGR